MDNEKFTEENDKNRLPIKKRYFIIFLSIVAVLCGAYFIYDLLGYESTDDAYIETTTVSVSPKVPGEVVKVLIQDNQPVKAGDVVAIIDQRDYKVRLEQAQAAYDKAILYQNNAQANLIAANSDIELAKKDVERYENLYNAGAVSKQTLDKAVTHLNSMQAKQTMAEQAIFSANPNDNAKVADAELNVLKAQLDAASLAMEYTKVIAPIDGTVSNKRVEVGMMVQPGTPLFVIVPDKVWVVANFKETQLQKMKEHQPVDIKIDTYPKKVFKGEIESFQRASGAKSSLFPPENAVGSFVKIVQRIPVKIVFTEKINPDEYKIIPGMSVVPKVNIRDQVNNSEQR